MPQRAAGRAATRSGKSTFARELARRLDVPYVELDALHHGPGRRKADGARSCGTHRRDRREWPERSAGRELVRLWTPREAREWLQAGEVRPGGGRS